MTPPRLLRRFGARTRLLMALALPVLASLAALALPRSDASVMGAAMIYLLAVVGAGLVGGTAGGLAASAEAFLGLNFFFTPPLYTLKVRRTEDLVALGGFLFVSSVVANLFTQLVDQRERAERRESETRLLYNFSARLLEKEPAKGPLSDFIRDLAELFDLASCKAYIGEGDGGEPALAASIERQVPSAEGTIDITIKTEREEIGMLRVSPREGKALSDADRDLLDTLVTHLALAMESARLQEQARAAQSLAETARIRAALFSSVTHDLRTPLASIKAAASSLLEGGVTFDPVQREDLVRTIAEESDRLNRLIRNLLDLSRLRAGAMLAQKAPTPIEDVVQAVVARLRSHLAGRKIDIRIREGIPPVPIDVIQIDQVLSNLLENALRYAPPHSTIGINISRWQSRIEAEVSDRGPGIPASERERVFEEFFRGEGSDGRGAGLGLSIARAIVQAHGGEMWVHETPGGGATVGFSLPLGAPGTP